MLKGISPAAVSKIRQDISALGVVDPVLVLMTKSIIKKASFDFGLAFHERENLNEHEIFNLDGISIFNDEKINQDLDGLYLDIDKHGKYKLIKNEPGSENNGL